MSLFTYLIYILSYVFEEIKERLTHAIRKCAGEHCHYYRLRAWEGENGKKTVAWQDIADVLFEEAIFTLSATERKKARHRRAIRLRRQAYDSGKVISFKRYQRERLAWPEIDPEMLELVERLEREAEEAKRSKEATVAVECKVVDEVSASLPEEIPVTTSMVTTKEPETLQKDTRTVVEKFLEETKDENIRKQIEIIFDLNPELKTIANSEKYTLQLSVVDGQVLVGAAKLIRETQILASV